MTWNERAKARLAQLGKPQDWLAEQFDMTPGGMQKWLAGTRQPSLEQINRIAATLDVSPVWLTHGVDPESSLDGLSKPAQLALRRFVQAERQHLAPSTVWQSLHAIADLAFPIVQADPAGPAAQPQGALGAPINPEKMQELEELAQQAEESHGQPTPRKRQRT